MCKGRCGECGYGETEQREKGRINIRTHRHVAKSLPGPISPNALKVVREARAVVRTHDEAVRRRVPVNPNRLVEVCRDLHSIPYATFLFNDSALFSKGSLGVNGWILDCC
jgi:hypothetical protein